MKKKIIAIAATAILGIVSFVACKKESGSSSPVNVSNTSSNVWDKTVYQQIGDKHNELLDLYNAYGYDSSGQMLNYAQTGLFFDSVLAAQGYVSQFTAAQVSKLTEDAAGNYYADEQQMFADMKQKFALYGQDSAMFSRKVDRLLALLQGVEQNANTTDDALAFIQTYENEMDATPMSDDERASILTSIYVYRASINYWKTHLPPADIVDLNGNQTLGGGWRCWTCVAAYDAIFGIVLSSAGPWTGLAGGAAMSVFARFCRCHKCTQFNNVSCG